jgi:exopolysaccharide biosynthesis predicted pyruvyltransferase EpsI
MSKILLRASKLPYEIFSFNDLKKKQLLAVFKELKHPGTKNIGNLLFAHATYKILNTNKNELFIDQYAATLSDSFSDDKNIEQINNEFDIFILPLCNSFRNDYKKELRRLTKLINKIKIPCVVNGVGAQLGLSKNFSELDNIKNEAYAFVSSVLDKSATIGVRGETTYCYLVNLGFPKNKIEIIGCPSMFYNGDILNIKEKQTELTTVTVSLPEQRKILSVGLRNFLKYLNTHSKNITYVPQVKRLMPYVANQSWPEDVFHSSFKNLFLEDKIKFFCDSFPWVEFLKTQSFVIGTRIHGNIAGIISGTPAHVLVHDSRTLELATYHEIPYSLLDQYNTLDLPKIYENSNYDPMIKNHKEKFDNYISFLKKNGISSFLTKQTELIQHDQQIKNKAKQFLLENNK